MATIPNRYVFSISDLSASDRQAYIALKTGKVVDFSPSNDRWKRWILSNRVSLSSVNEIVYSFLDEMISK